MACYVRNSKFGGGIRLRHLMQNLPKHEPSVGGGCIYPYNRYAEPIEASSCGAASAFLLEFLGTISGPLMRRDGTAVRLVG